MDDFPFVPNEDDETEITPEEDVLELAHQNFQALIIGTVAYFDRTGMSVMDWIEGLGSIFAKGWSPEEFTSIDDVWDQLLQTYRSLGAVITEADSNTTSTTATISGFPDTYL
nr:hypothetical protein [Chloroflexota bacterium]